MVWMISSPTRTDTFGATRINMPEQIITTVRYVVFHSPGPAWVPGVDFREQPGVAEHVAHYLKLFESGNLEMGGPFLENDAGGMMVSTTGMSKAEIEDFAAQDPAVISGLLVFEVKTWYTPMSTHD